MHFQHLRESVWSPTFEWVATRRECADKINSYHEDYPKYVEVTDEVLGNTTSVDTLFISNERLLLIHRTIFSDKSFAGKWRGVDVVVGLHSPPQKLLVSDLMDELESLYYITTIEALTEWYKDFETIHPFQDGNGRVGSVVVASYAHFLYPDKGWLAPNQ